MKRAASLVLAFLLALSVVVSPIFAKEFIIKNNGAGSTSEINYQVTNQTNITQNNNADINNNLDTNLNTGDNSASDNNGEVNIETGDITENIDVENSGNTSIVEQACCPANNTTLEIIGNGSDSLNTINYKSVNRSTVSVNQLLNLENNLTGTANTGDNTAGDNLGDTSVETGNITINANLENKNINRSFVKGTTGSGPEILSKISGNGANSINTVDTENRNEYIAVVENQANILNNLMWNPQSGGNNLSGNLGKVKLKTGDILVNLILKNKDINISEIALSCCDSTPPPPPSPSPSPSISPSPDPSVSPSPSPSGEPSPSPSPSSSNPPGGGGDGGKGGDGGGNGDSSGGSAGEVLGAILPATGGYDILMMTFVAISLFCLGFKLRQDSLAVNLKTL